MKYKTIKITEKNYAFLLREATILQQKYGQKASFDDAITELARRKKVDILSFAGSINEQTAQKMKDAIKQMREKDK
jgi:predicted CopG family antitoxin